MKPLARRASFALLALLPASCVPAEPSGAPPGAAETEALCFEVRPELGRHLEAERVGGVVAVLEGGARCAACSGPACAERSLPASTFKIPSAAVGLELGLLAGPDAPMPWDGERRAIDAWNRDHTLASAMRASCVPCFQDLARKVGEARMRAWVARLRFGDARVEGPIDGFWLDGGSLAISPVEQLGFLRRLDQGELPIAPRTRRVLLDILELERRGEAAFRGKTGWANVDAPNEIGWFVGWVRAPSRVAYVAVRVDARPPDVGMGPVRRRIAARTLEALGALPPKPAAGP